MSFPISPAVDFREIDASVVAEQLSSSNGSIAGKFTWGPVNQRVRISNEEQLVAAFGKPSDVAYVDFMLASSFLAYSNALDVVRIGSETLSKNAVSTGSPVSVLNSDDYAASVPSTAEFIARFPGAIGNSLSVVVCGTPEQYSTTLPGTFVFTTSNTVTYTKLAAETLTDYFQVGDMLVVDGDRYPVTSVTATTLKLNKIYVGTLSPTTTSRLWKYGSLFSGAPAATTFHLVVVDTQGKFKSEPGGIVEYYTLSTVPGTIDEGGLPTFYQDALVQQSRYILAGTLALSFGVAKLAKVFDLTGGDDAFGTLGTIDYINGYDLYKNPDEVDAPLMIGGDAIKQGSAVLANYLISNIAEVRRDTVLFLSPSLTACQSKGREVDLILNDRNLLPSTSYATLDSGWKYMFDRYNNKYRWIPLNADHAGIYSQVDRDIDPWYSGGGVVKGRIKNCVKLAFSPNRTQRDTLYPKGVNPVVSFPAVGPVMYGDKTLLAIKSVFTQIPVRRLFIIVEKTVATAAANLMFEFNDEFTQRRFVSIVEPFLREVQGRRGITDYRIISDATVNTPQVVQTNRFVGQVFLKAQNSIYFVRLDFVAVNASSTFEEVIGTF